MNDEIELILITALDHINDAYLELDKIHGDTALGWKSWLDRVYASIEKHMEDNQ